jgi:hypothetical protein
MANKIKATIVDVKSDDTNTAVIVSCELLIGKEKRHRAFKIVTNTPPSFDTFKVNLKEKVLAELDKENKVKDFKSWTGKSFDFDVQ